MAVPMYRRIAGWIFHNLLWDTTGTAHQGFRKGLWATRKLVLAVVLSALLDWFEWAHHHPPDMAFVALVHFVVVLALIALVVNVWRGFGRTRK